MTKAIKHGSHKRNIVDLDLSQQVDQYFEGAYAPSDSDMEYALKIANDKRLPPIAVSPLHGKFLNMMVGITGAKRVLELGTLSGYSAICMAKALPDDGKLITLEIRDICVDLAERAVKNAGLQDKVEIRYTPALEGLEILIEDGEAPFDLIFIDADKPNYHRYIEAVLPLTRSGTLIIIDNVVLGGDVIERGSENHSVRSMRKMNEFIAANTDQLDSTMIQTTGLKGLDGFSLVRVK